MNVRLIDYTRRAVEMLIFTKSTRRTEPFADLDEVARLPQAEKDEALKAVLATIRSSWEFVDYTFQMNGVTRAFTHQLVRHRVGVAFAQQAMRLNVGKFEVVATGAAKIHPAHAKAVLVAQQAYEEMLADGVPPQDARGVIPTNAVTSILMKVNLRAFADMCEKRLCTRAQGEFQEVVRECRKLVIAVHPWTGPVLYPWCGVHGSCQFPDSASAAKCPIRGQFPQLVEDPRFYSDQVRRLFDREEKMGVVHDIPPVEARK